MVFFTRLKYLGYEVVFRIPQFNIDNIDEPWKNLYTKKYFDWDESLYKRYNQLEKSTYIDYIQGLEVKDDGKPFNILEASEPDIEGKGLNERKIGGLGIHFVRHFSDDIHYERNNNENILTIIKLIQS